MTEILAPLTHDPSAVLVHDIGNYIQIAMSAMRLMSQDDRLAGSAALVAMLAQAQQSLDRAGALIRLSRIGPLIEEETRLEACLMEMATLLRYATGPHVRVRLHVGLVPPVRVSKVGLQSVLLNLAINARDAMPAGGTLTISALLADGPSTPEVEIVVADTGAGMAGDILSRAFEPHFSTKPSGSGLGLAGAKQFIEAAGGRIAIESVSGRGTAVVLRLPATP